MKNTKILVFLVLLLTAALTLCACGLFKSNDGGNPEPQTTTETYEYAFNIGDNSIKYVVTMTHTEGEGTENFVAHAYLNGKDMGEVSSGTIAVGSTPIDVNGLWFDRAEGGKMVYNYGSSDRLINPYEAFAGEYNFNDQYTITLTADGKASASVDAEQVLDYYPIGMDKIAVVRNGSGYVYRIQRIDNTIWQEEGVAAGVTAENLTAYCNMVFSTDRYYGEGYFYDAYLYKDGGKCVIVGPFFIALEYTENDGVLTTAQGNFKITGNSFDFVVQKEFQSGETVLKIYENGMAYFSGTEYVNGGRREAIATGDNSNIAGAIYDYSYDKTYVFDKALNCVYAIYGRDYIDVASLQRYDNWDANSFVAFNEDLTEGCTIHHDTNLTYVSVIRTERKLCDNLILGDDGYLYAFTDDGNLDYLYVDEGLRDLLSSADSCTSKTVDWIYTDGDETVEDQLCFIIESGDDLFLLHWKTEEGYLSLAVYKDMNKYENIWMDGERFIKIDDTAITFLNLNRYETLVTNSARINEYFDGYFTVSEGKRHYFINKETLAFEFCIEDENFARNVENIVFDKHIINTRTFEIYATLYYTIYNASVYIYIPIELEAVSLFDGLYRYQTDNVWYNYIYIWDASPYYYSYDTNWNAWEETEASEPDSVETYRNVENEQDALEFGNNIVHISICHYGDTVKMYICAFYYPEDGSKRVLNFYDTVIEGTYAYDEASDVITVTAEDYVYTISTVTVEVDYQYKAFTREAVSAE